MEQKVFIKTFGCQMNVYDSNRIFDLIKKIGYEKTEKYEEAKFIFERNIVYNPKDAKTYLYLAKIYNHQDDQRKEENNLTGFQINQTV